MIESFRSGLLYRNPRPHVRSVHAYFPSVAAMDNGELLATLVLGEAFEAVDLHTHVARSTDQGESWQLEGALYPRPPGELSSDACRIRALPGGEVLALMARFDRSRHPDEGLTNPRNMGFAPTELLLLRSRDYGRSFGGAEFIAAPLVGPAFELCCPITPLRDGRWLLPTSTWRGWEGECPEGMKMVAFVSADQGRSWPQYLEVMGDPAQRLIYWESKIVELADGRLLASAWTYDQEAARDLENRYALSADGGASWSPPRSTGLRGQTLTPLALEDGRLLCVYRRLDKPGLWANLSRLEGEEWINEQCAPLWGEAAAGLTAHGRNMARNFNVLRFGAPCLSALADGTILVAFWCYEECVANIRWFKLRLPDP